MSSSQDAAARKMGSALARAETFAPLGARRLLVLGGIGLILVGMLFGDIFAVFVLHQNAARVGSNLAGAAHAALNQDAAAVQAYFQNVGAFLENRGTKVDAHVHMIDFGYLALLFALIEPWIVFSPLSKRRIAWTFLFGAALLPVGVFLIHYAGPAYSPLKSIGWASIFADFSGTLVLLATLSWLAGLWKHFRTTRHAGQEDQLMADRSAVSRLLLQGGALLVLLGLLGGIYYAAFDLYRYEAQDFTNLSQMAAGAAADNAAAVDRALADYGQLQGDKAVKIAAHAHVIEFGLLSMMLAFFQPYVSLREAWKRYWAIVLLTGSLLLPISVLLEPRFGLVAGGLADFGGLLVIIALLATWVGILRCTGSLDAPTFDFDGGRGR